MLCFSALTTPPLLLSLFFFKDTATTEIYTLSLHDALPISFYRDYAERSRTADGFAAWLKEWVLDVPDRANYLDRKSTRLNSSHVAISYAVFCLKKKKIEKKRSIQRHVLTSYADLIPHA